MRALSGYEWKDERKRRGLEAYMLGIVAYKEEPHNRKKALEDLYEALESDPDEPLYPRIAARLEIHEGRYRQAISLLAQSLDRIRVPNEKAIACLLLGQAYDLEGEREGVPEMYETVFRMNREGKDNYFTGINDLVAGLAQKGITKSFKRSEVDSISVVDEMLE